MTVPVILGMILLMTFSLVDTYFVSLLGTEELAAISFTFPVTFTVISLNIGLGIGTSAVIGKLLGSGDASKAKEYATASVLLITIMVGVLSFVGYLLIGPIFSAMGAEPELITLIHEYMSIWYLSAVFMAIPMVANSVLRASGDTSTPSIIMALGGAINAVLDPILIFGFKSIPAFGIKGAAMATCIAWLICAIYVIHLLAIKRGLMESKLLPWLTFIKSSKSILAIGLPAAGSNMLTPIAGAIVTAFVAKHGAHAVAAWGVGSRIESIATIIVLALSMSLPPFISQNYGAQRVDRISQAYKLCIGFVIIWQLIVFAIVFAISPYIASVFADDPKVVSLIVTFLSIVPLGYGVQGLVILTNSSFNAMHEPMAAVWLSIIRLFVFFVPFAFVSSTYFGMTGLFIGCVLANVLTACVSFIWFKRQIAYFKQSCFNAGVEPDVETKLLGKQ